MADRRAVGRLPALVVALLVAALLAACGAAPRSAGSSGPAAGAPTGPPAASTSSAAGAPLLLPAAEPTRIEIPALGVRAPVSRLGLNADGTVEVPPLDRPGDAGWYQHGPTPGELGPAVVLGHVDSRAGPAVFAKLGDLKPGELIRIVRTDGRAAVFRTTTVEQVPKAQFPTDKVYGDLDHAGLRLITCGGSFDQTRRSYLNNVIVYAVLAEVGPA